MISGSFVKNDLQLKATKEPLTLEVSDLVLVPVCERESSGVRACERVRDRVCKLQKISHKN